jgi:hypothetical protein
VRPARAERARQPAAAETERLRAVAAAVLVVPSQAKIRRPDQLDAAGIMANRSKNSEKIKSVVNLAREKRIVECRPSQSSLWTEQTEMVVEQPKRSPKLLN